MTSVLEADGGYVVLTGTVQWDEVAYWSRCPELGVASCGDTIEEALDNLGEALEMFFEDLADIGTLDRELREKGITVKTGPLPTESVVVSVPLGLTLRIYIQPIPALVPAGV